MLLTKAGCFTLAMEGRRLGEWMQSEKERKGWAEFQQAVLDDRPQQRHGNATILLQGSPAIQHVWAPAFDTWEEERGNRK